MKQDENSSQKSDQTPAKSVILNALSMALGTMSSRVLGLLRETLLTAMFSRSITDAWTVAFRLPNIFRRLLGEGSLSVSFIPVFVETRIEGNPKERATNLVNSLYSLLLLVLTVLTTLGILFTPQILNWLLDPAYAQVPGKLELTIRMSRWMFSFIFLMSSYAFFMGILNALGEFAWPAMAPTFFNMAMIVSTLIPSSWLTSSLGESAGGDGLAWGVLIGGAIQAGILIPSLKRRGYWPKWQWDLRNRDMLLVLRNMVPGLIGLGLLQITTLVNQNFASSLGEGAITYIYVADRLLELPLSLVSVSLGTALLPTLAGFSARKDHDHFVETLQSHVLLSLYLVLGAATGLFLLAEPILRLLFEHGHFGANDTAQTVIVLQVWALIMIPTSLVRMLVPAYYAVKNTWFPATVSLICLTVHILLAPWLMKNYGLRGLNVSSLVSSGLNFLLLISMLSTLVYPLAFLSFVKRVFLLLLTCLPMGLFLWSVADMALPRGISLLNLGFRLTLLIMVAVGIFLATSWGLKLPEFQSTFERVIRRLSTRLRR